MKRVVVGVLSSVLMVSCGGCSKSGSDDLSKKESNAYSSYVDGYNKLLEDPQKMVEDYQSNFPEEGPQEGSDYELRGAHTNAVDELKFVREAFAEGRKSISSEMGEMASAADSSIALMSRIYDLYDSAQVYYAGQDYRDDGYAKGKMLHAQMVTAVDGYRKHLDIFGERLSSYENTISLKEIKQYEGKKGNRYWYRFYNFQAKQLVQAAESPEKYLQAFEQYDSAYTGLKAFVASEGDKIHVAYSSYVGVVENFHGYAKKVRRSMQNNEPVDENDADLLNSSYNSLVGISNSFGELEAYKQM